MQCTKSEFDRFTIKQHWAVFKSLGFEVKFLVLVMWASFIGTIVCYVVNPLDHSTPNEQLIAWILYMLPMAITKQILFKALPQATVKNLLALARKNGFVEQFHANVMRIGGDVASAHHGHSYIGYVRAYLSALKPDFK